MGERRVMNEEGTRRELKGHSCCKERQVEWGRVRKGWITKERHGKQRKADVWVCRMADYGLYADEEVFRHPLHH